MAAPDDNKYAWNPNSLMNFHEDVALAIDRLKSAKTEKDIRDAEQALLMLSMQGMSAKSRGLASVWGAPMAIPGRRPTAKEQQMFRATSAAIERAHAELAASHQKHKKARQARARRTENKLRLLKLAYG